jgi:hypothetical protein
MILRRAPAALLVSLVVLGIAPGGCGPALRQGNVGAGGPGGGCPNCDGEENVPFWDDGSDEGPDDGQKPWTVMIYFATHVSSSPALVQSVKANLRAMRQVGAGPYANVIIQYHRPDARADGSVKDVRLWLPAEGQDIDSPDEVAGLPVMKELDGDDADSGNPQTLENFVAETMAGYPAQRYALVMHGHGFAWSGFAFDELYGSHMKLDQLADAVDRGRTRAAVPGQDPARLDLTMFDACLMSTIEVATQMAPETRYLLMSEDVEVAAGQPYQDVLPELTIHPRMETEHIMANIAHAYVYYYSQARGYTGPPPQTALTLVGLDLDKVGGLVGRLEAVATAVRRAGGLQTPQVRDLLASRDMTVVDDEIHSADLYQLLSALEEADTTSPEVKDAANQARTFIGYPRDGYNPAERAVVVHSGQPAVAVFGLDGWQRNDDVTGTMLPASYDGQALGLPSPPGMLFRGVPLEADPEPDAGGFGYRFHPFVPNALQFDWLLVDGNGAPLGEPGGVQRERDYYVTQSFQSRSPDSPFVVEAHTQGYYFPQGHTAGSAMVHGLGVFFGTSLRTFGDYRNFAFPRQTKWGCMFRNMLNCPPPG